MSQDVALTASTLYTYDGSARIRNGYGVRSDMGECGARFDLLIASAFPGGFQHCGIHDGSPVAVTDRPSERDLVMAAPASRPQGWGRAASWQCRMGGVAQQAGASTIVPPAGGRLSPTAREEHGSILA